MSDVECYVKDFLCFALRGRTLSLRLCGTDLLHACLEIGTLTLIFIMPYIMTEKLRFVKG